MRFQVESFDAFETRKESESIQNPLKLIDFEKHLELFKFIVFSAVRLGVLSSSSRHKIN